MFKDSPRVDITTYTANNLDEVYAHILVKIDYLILDFVDIYNDEPVRQESDITLENITKFAFGDQQIDNDILDYKVFFERVWSKPWPIEDVISKLVETKGYLKPDHASGEEYEYEDEDEDEDDDDESESNGIGDDADNNDNTKDLEKLKRVLSDLISEESAAMLYEMLSERLIAPFTLDDVLRESKKIITSESYYCFEDAMRMVYD